MNFFVRRPSDVSYRVFSEGDFGAWKEKRKKKKQPDKSTFSFWFRKQNLEMKGHVLQILLSFLLKKSLKPLH